MLSFRAILFLLDLFVTVLLLSNVSLFKTIKRSRLLGRSATPMLWHLALIYLLATLYLSNELLDMFSYPMIFLIWANDHARALILSQYIQFMTVAIIDFVLALGFLYMFFRMSTSISNRQLLSHSVLVGSSENPFLSLKQAYEESTSHLSHTQQFVDSQHHLSQEVHVQTAGFNARESNSVKLKNSTLVPGSPFGSSQRGYLAQAAAQNSYSFYGHSVLLN